MNISVHIDEFEKEMLRRNYSKNTVEYYTKVKEILIQKRNGK